MRASPVLKRIALACVLLPLLALAAWYAIAFLPHLATMKASSARGLAASGDAVRMLKDTSASPGNVRGWAVRTSYAAAHPQGLRDGMLAWHANTLLWYSASVVHFNDADILGIYIDCASGACGQGLPSAAERYFGKSLRDVTPREMASLVAHARYPARSFPAPDASH